MAQDLSTPRAVRKAQNLKPQRPVKEDSPPPKSEEKTVESWILNFGTYTEYFNSVQNDTSGGTRKFDFAPTIGGGMFIPMSSYDLKFLPEINWVLPRSAGSSKIIKNLFMFRADLGYDALDWLRFRLGTSLMWSNQHGRGGSTQVNNGNGTSTFYYPDENRSSLNNTLDIGIETMIDDWSLRLQTYTYSIFIKERRQTSYTLFVSYYWDR
jgi:hypothetical protein